MFKARRNWVLMSVAALAITIGSGPGRTPAQDAAEPAPPAATQPERKPRAKPRGRLPFYYTKVVDKQQREQIYAIQAKHADAIAKIRAELAKVVAERDAEIRAVLTPEQQQQIDKLRAEAMARQRSRTKQ